MARRKRKRTNGSIRQQGESWQIRWREKGRRRSATFPDRDTADKVLRRIIGDIAAGRGGLEVERPPSPPLSKLAEEWLKRREATHRSWRDDASRWRVHLAPAFGRMLPDEVTVADVRRFVEDGSLLASRPPPSGSASHCSARSARISSSVTSPSRTSCAPCPAPCGA